MLAGRWILLLLWAAIYSTCIAETHREGKFLGLFTIKTFKNTKCGSGTGVCYTKDECSQHGGKNSGKSCADNSGVCCQFSYTCGGSTSQLISYFTNPSGMSMADNKALGSCTFTVTANNVNVTQIRLDLMTFEMEGISTTTGQCEKDHLSVPGLSNMGIPNLCGVNTGQHVYVPLKDDRSLTMNMVTSGDTAYRWYIKVTQIDAMLDPDWVAPAGCVQYHIDQTGYIESYNFDNGDGTYQKDLNYAICIKRAQSTCRVMYEATDEHFSIHTEGNVNVGHKGNIDGTDPNCARSNVGDYVLLPDSGNHPLTLMTEDKFCGDVLTYVDESPVASPVSSYATGPIKVTFHTDYRYFGPPNEVGFRLKYSQQPDC